MEGGEGGGARGLSALLVLEVAGTPGAAFAGAMLGDFGARVVVVEPPGGSPLRCAGPPAAREVWWGIAARNKLSLALDADHPRAAEVIERLVARAAILLRDNPAGSWLAAARRAERPPLDLHLHAPGEDRPDLWPHGTAPELAAAASGMMALTGEAGGTPALPEFPLADASAGLLAAACGLLELRAAHLGSRAPTPVPVGLHEALLRMNEWHTAAASAQGFPELRNGNRFPMNSNIGNILQTRDGELLTVSAATPSVAERLLEMIGGPELRADPRFATPQARRDNMDALEGVVAEWMSRHDAEDALREAAARDVVVGPLYDAARLLSDPHIAARGDVVWAEGVPAPAPIPRLPGLALDAPRPGPATPGQDSDAVLRGAGFSDPEINDLRAAGAVWN